MKRQKKAKWLSKQEAHDYIAAESYLTLRYDYEKAGRVVRRLKRAPMTSFKAKDIFRASGLSLLGVSNSHVENDRKKIRLGRKISPIILVRDKVSGKVIIADGYHRMCAVYSFDENAQIPAKIV